MSATGSTAIETPPTSRQLCTFFVDGMVFGVDVMNVQEVFRYQDMTAVPLASTLVRGLINLRGQIVTAIELRARLGLPARSGDAPPMNVVTTTSGGVMSWLVDEIGDVIEVEDVAFERAPENLSAAFRDLVPGVFKLDDRLLILLDAEKVAALGASVVRGGANSRDDDGLGAANAPQREK